MNPVLNWLNTLNESGKAKQISFGWGKILALLIFIMELQGTLGFTSFVLEEAEQTCMFGGFTWSKKDMKSFARMRVRHISACFYLHDTAEPWNNTVELLYIFGFAYRNYQSAR